MADIGTFNALKIVKTVDFGVYLNGGDLGEILLPRRYVPGNMKIGESLEVFLYFDSEDRLIATTEKPLARVGDFAFLEAVAVNAVGAFLNWGLPKDLFVPYSEQRPPMQAGKKYVVFLYLDRASRRIVASAKIDKHLSKEPAPFKPGQVVDLLIYGKSELGYKAVVENSHGGILYKNEVFRALQPGDLVKGHIRKVRDDGKIDLRLDKPGYGNVGDLGEKILAALKANDGFLEVTDKSPADLIASLFGTSKNAFKMALGALYKKRMITLDEFGITLVDHN
ncbi:MAG: S1-like domain-containing RNA-binding protein [Candidatus Aminicenantes bacterium]|nr:S1-like domain-containing RNA-binding protein [Candidatus Aminicenantes bacterium]